MYSLKHFFSLIFLYALGVKVWLTRWQIPSNLSCQSSPSLPLPQSIDGTQGWDCVLLALCWWLLLTVPLHWIVLYLNLVCCAFEYIISCRWCGVAGRLLKHLYCQSWWAFLSSSPRMRRHMCHLIMRNLFFVTVLFGTLYYGIFGDLSFDNLFIMTSSWHVVLHHWHLYCFTIRTYIM